MTILSIIIPALNEEKHLSLLLESIKKQSFKDLEIIVADGGSADKTVEVSRNYGAKVVLGGSPAQGRNAGAKIAKGDLFLFLDADTIMPEGFLEKNLGDFQKRNLGTAIFFQDALTDRKFFKCLFSFAYNWLALLMSSISLFGGVGILVKKSIHEKIGGWNEESKISEDVLYLKKACRAGRYGTLRKVRLQVSVRRYEKEGWFKTYFKHLFGGWYVTFFGPFKSNILKYKFGQHEKKS